MTKIPESSLYGLLLTNENMWDNIFCQDIYIFWKLIRILTSIMQTHNFATSQFAYLYNVPKNMYSFCEEKIAQGRDPGLKAWMDFMKFVSILKTSFKAFWGT